MEIEACVETFVIEQIQRKSNRSESAGRSKTKVRFFSYTCKTAASYSKILF